MNECTEFTITVKSEIASIFDDVVASAARKGLQIKGDATRGTVKHSKYKVQGTYTVRGKAISFKLEEDEYFANCDDVESKFREALKGY